MLDVVYRTVMTELPREWACLFLCLAGAVGVWIRAALRLVLGLLLWLPSARLHFKVVLPYTSNRGWCEKDVFLCVSAPEFPTSLYPRCGFLPLCSPPHVTDWIAHCPAFAYLLEKASLLSVLKSNISVMQTHMCLLLTVLLSWLSWFFSPWQPRYVLCV